MPRPEKIILAVGLPASGKSTYFERLGVNAISSDAVRLQLTDDATAQNFNDAIFATVRFLLRQRLTLGRPVTCIDATNLTPAERQPYVLMAREFGCRIEALWFNVPLPVCKARNAGRGRIVPDQAMDQLAARFIPPDVAEGFDQVLAMPQS